MHLNILEAMSSEINFTRLIPDTRILIRVFRIFCISLLCPALSYAQDNCSGGVTLCASSTITRTTNGATADGSDPVLSCGDNTFNNSVSFRVNGINAGNCTVTVTNINNNPGL